MVYDCPCKRNNIDWAAVKSQAVRGTHSAIPCSLAVDLRLEQSLQGNCGRVEQGVSHRATRSTQ